MDNQELEHLLTDLESDLVERKESAANADKIREAMCAFANDLPNHGRAGVIFVGAKDNGDGAGLTITDGLLTKLADMRSDGAIVPLPTIYVEKKMLRGVELAMVRVEPADAPPIRCKGRVYVRVGPTTRLATPEEERRLAEKRRTKDLPWELGVVSFAEPADLDEAYFLLKYLPATTPADVLAENDRPPLHRLQALRFMETGAAPRPTRLGILAVGKDPRWFIPGAYIQFLRIDGPTLADPIKNAKELFGPVGDVLRQVDDVLDLNVQTAIDITSGPREIRTPDYPVAALRQLTYNAVMHRTYEGTNAPVQLYWFDDRVEIHNPGGPYGRVTKKNFGLPGFTDYRNIHLAGVMKDLGFVQKFGAGIQIARQALKANGNPEVEFIVEETRVVAVVRPRK
jgi:ATP-dependent DNA helicase RecG